MTYKPFACSLCSKHFTTRHGGAQHTVDAHAGNAKITSPRERGERQAKTREPSMADLVVQATIDRAMGLPVDEDISSMFGDYL